MAILITIPALAGIIAASLCCGAAIAFLGIRRVKRLARALGC